MEEEDGIGQAEVIRDWEGSRRGGREMKGRGGVGGDKRSFRGIE